MLTRIIFFLFTFLLIFPSSSKSQEIYKLNIPDEIIIKLNNKNYNKYIRTGMRAYSDGSTKELNNIKKKYKRWIKAEIAINSNDKKNVKAMIRIAGDAKDHLRLPFTSLKVKILDDDFYGVRRFSLFLPHTRNEKNEVFWTLLLRQIGFPTFYTKMIDVNLNGKKYQAVFQENASKEFLERNSIRETVILKNNDFQFYLNSKQNREYLAGTGIYKNFFKLSMIIDNANFLDNTIATKIASDAIAVYSANNLEEKVINYDLFFELNARYAPHALQYWNAKYIFVPHKKAFLPLYYDGMVDLPVKKANCKLESNFKNLKAFSEEYKKLTKKELSIIQKCVFQDVLLFYEKYKKKNIKKSDYIHFFNDKYKNKDQRILYDNIKNKISDHFKNTKLKEKINKNGMLYSFTKDHKYYLCEINIENENVEGCQRLTNTEYNNTISKTAMSRSLVYSKFNKNILFPVNLGSFDEFRKIKEISNSLELQDQTYVLDKPYLYIFEMNSKKERVYNFLFENSEARLIISGNSSNNKFNFIGNVQVAKNENIVRFDENLLTGCANFLNMKFNNDSIFSQNMKCEDAVNAINSEGTIDEVEIYQSEYDGLDLDYSNILIKKMFISKSGNDCSDFSFGNYTIQESIVDECGDKAFSFGETSKALVKNSLIKNSLSGLVSKDNSFVKIENSKAVNVKEYCLSAYNKKPEFEGGKIIKLNFTCEKESLKEFQDLKSSIKNE